MGLKGGWSLNITGTDVDGKPWGCSKQDMRIRVENKIMQDMSLLFIGSPMCTAWCAWRHLSNQVGDPAIVERERVRARLHLDFVLSLYRDQLEVFFSTSIRVGRHLGGRLRQ